jgi:hypothetical protein
MLNGDILKDVLDGNYVSFKEKIGAEVDIKLKEKLETVKAKYPDFLASQLNEQEKKEDKPCTKDGLDDSEEGKFKCKACGKTFNSKKEFDDHLPTEKKEDEKKE